MSGGITIRNLSKSFFGVPVLKGLDLEIRSGEVLGIVGENGAGKSTLMNILGGHLRADAGTMLLNAQPYAPRSARAALASGVGLVHQELNLFPNLSVAENLFLTTAPTIAGWLRRRPIRRAAETLLQRVGMPCSPGTLVANLSAGQQQLVELARVLAADSQVVLLDEPTTSLSDRETTSFFRLVRELAAEGRAVVFISHAILDVLRRCQRIAILRDGELVDDLPTATIDVHGVIQRMVGRPVSQLFPERRVSARSASAPAVLRVKGVGQPRVVSDISFDLDAGEVLGVFGLMGAGRSELARMLMGLEPYKRGEVYLGKRKLVGGPRERIAHGLGLVTESRRTDGILADSSVAENLSLVALRRFCRRATGRVQRSMLGTAVDSMRAAVRLQRHLGNEQAMKTLSGGNQQKVVVGKWLLNEPRVLILDEPTRGIDVAAKFELYQLIYKIAGRGSGVIVISSDLEELMGICDRMLVMSLGKMTAEFDRASYDREQIMAAAFQQHLRHPVTETVVA